MFENGKNKILTCFFQAVFFSRKKPFFSEKNKLVFFGLQPYICLCLSRKLLPWNNRLSWASSPTTFSPGRWWPWFVPFTRTSFCSWTIQLSPSCRSPFQRPVAVWLRASTSNATFVTLKRRQLLLSHVVPSVSDAQKKNLLLDPFFQTSSLFSSSSVEAACCATRDLSSFKPHLKASSSTTPSRRPPYSSSSAQRGPARQFSRQSSSQRSSSPFRL